MLHQGDEGGTNLGPVMETIREVTNNAADADNAVVGGGNQDAAVDRCGLPAYRDVKGVWSVASGVSPPPGEGEEQWHIHCHRLPA